MIHIIRTGYGDSDLTYSGDTLAEWGFHQQVILQDNTTGSDIWSALSSVVFEILHIEDLDVRSFMQYQDNYSHWLVFHT